jgi:hypothetical protein
MDFHLSRPYVYASGLVVGILFFTPAIALIASALGAPAAPVLLLTLAAILMTFGVVALVTDDVPRALLVLILVLATIRANVPLGTVPGGTLDVGPQFLLVDTPLLIFLAITASSWSRRHFTAPLTLMGLFVGWCLLSMPVVPGPHPDVMGWYAVHVARYTLVGLVVARGIIDKLLTGREALTVIGIAALGHAVVATGQILTGPIPILSVLGANGQIVASIGSIPTGPYVGGFMGGAPLAVFLTLLLPAVTGLGVSNQRLRIPALLVAGWWALLLQFTAWDAVRGAIIVAFGVAFLLLGWWATGVLWNRAALLGGIRDVLTSGSIRTIAITTGVGVATGVQALTGFGPVQPRYIGGHVGQRWAESISIPGFSTQNLAIRIYQYVTGLDVFLQYPLTGVGGANFVFVSEAYGRGIPMHNVYIGTLAETGVVGSILFFGALWIAARRLWWLAQDSDDPALIGLFAGFIGVLAMQFFQPQYLRVTSMLSLWIVLGTIVGEVRRRRGSPVDHWHRAWGENRLTSALSSAWVATISERIVAVSNRVASTGYQYFQRSATASIVRKFY